MSDVSGENVKTDSGSNVAPEIGSEPGAEARSFKAKLSKRSAVYWASFALALTLPPALEFLSGSSIGPESRAFIVLLWTPWVVLTFLGLRYKRDAWIAAMPLILIFLLTAVNWPENPPMGFLNQLTHETGVAITGWAMAAFFLRAVMDLKPCNSTARSKNQD